jgi:tRNA G18 (ribose-2'-O)-methylase SpoU
MNPIIVAQMARGGSMARPCATFGVHGVVIGKHPLFSYTRRKLS